MNVKPHNHPHCPIGYGDANGYVNRGCRCEWCTEAWRLYHLAYMERHPEQRRKAATRERARYHAQRMRRVD